MKRVKFALIFKIIKVSCEKEQDSTIEFLMSMRKRGRLGEILNSVYLPELIQARIHAHTC